ncbi:fluoride efflux transporter CrcB [Herbiconiux moechotypicola]|uniref:Fluoride-specific ion channel FluC n=1 Tax=Herbiconiux moechotypicola TaxID=637393 RepID=A0ABN3DA16_9MICO|nr:fluoride efflux transporter CrcB [Herbiconiux moechotypicola]MCS5729001.1 fluoride efflux transporter CrcB [Herbiconiux moechotypicola]
MTALVFVALSLAGGLGAALRFVVDGVVKARIRSSFPVGVMLINLSGSLLLGFFTGLALGAVLSPEWLLIVGTGFLGGYTTFSTASFETVRLLQTGRLTAGLLNGLGMLAATVSLSYLGLWLGTLLAG